jgi:hypothetical protein
MATSYDDRDIFGISYSSPPLHAEPARSPLSPWRRTSHHSAGDLSFTLPMSTTSRGYDPFQPREVDRAESEEYNLPLRNSSPSVVELSRSTSSYSQSLSHSHQPLVPSNEPVANALANILSDNYNDDDLDNFFLAHSPSGWNSEPSSPFSNADFNQPHWNRLDTRESTFVDLTEDSPEMPPGTRSKRRAPSEDAEPRGTKRRRSGDSTNAQSNARACASGSTTKTEDSIPKTKIEEVDLVDVEDEEDYAKFTSQRQADMIKQQQKEEAEKPAKLATTQCVICLDQPEDLAVTHCGTFFYSYLCYERH